jgi:hypothetical protein
MIRVLILTNIVAIKIIKNQGLKLNILYEYIIWAIIKNLSKKFKIIEHRELMTIQKFYN